MASTIFNGQLTTNKVIGSLFNMIISETINEGQLGGGFGLPELFRTEGTMYGDTKLFIAHDKIGTKEMDWDDTNVLVQNKIAKEKVKEQAITLDQFRQAEIAVGQYLLKQAFASEGTFAQFENALVASLGQSQSLYENTLLNAYVGTVSTEAAINTVEVADASAQTVGEAIANLMITLKDDATDYNDYGFRRGYKESDFIVVWNAEYVNKFRKIDLPVIFHNEGILNSFDYVLPAKYFGDVSDATTSVANARLLKAQASVVDKYGDEKLPGDLVTTGTTVAKGSTYVPNSKIICKLVHKDAIKFMAGFKVATSFFNPKNLVTNHYLTWGYSEPAYLFDKPIITIVSK